ncbi:TIGR03915 family putative DNA repair protein [Orbaceae bacterium ESL0727]|nr:TIGR03915 family putative DNA repair protein [Orbaceae bacterium ESL0727]
MVIFYYDKTLEGLLSAVFDAFKLKKSPEQLLTQGDIAPLFATDIHHVETRNSKYERVQLAMTKRLANITLRQLMAVWFSELPESDHLIFRYLCKTFRSPSSIETDFADPDVLQVRQIAQKVSKECEHLRQFVRFNAINNPTHHSNDHSTHMAGGEPTASPQSEKIYFAVVDPIYNALPLTLDFFEDRFADQKWAIYDSRRQYGFFYDLKRVEPFNLLEQDDLLVNDAINSHYLTEDEQFFQHMWQRYCQALTIKERLNPKLQRQFMPKRFWHHLPEMAMSNNPTSNITDQQYRATISNNRPDNITKQQK